MVIPPSVCPSFAALIPLPASADRVMPCPDGVPVAFEPFLEQCDVCGASDAVRPFDDDELAFQVAGFYGREALAIEFKSTHLRILFFLAPVSALVTIARI
jgi:hypothetical protein